MQKPEQYPWLLGNPDVGRTLLSAAFVHPSRLVISQDLSANTSPPKSADKSVRSTFNDLHGDSLSGPRHTVQQKTLALARQGWKRSD